MLVGTIRYSLERRQFGPKNKPEILLLDYLSHQKRLLPLVARTYAFSIGMSHLKDIVDSKNIDQKQLHVLAAGVKAFLTWHLVNVGNVTRQACGGQGFRTENLVGKIKNDGDVGTTFEGDNTVLTQQVAASLLKEFQAQFARGKLVAGLFNYYSQEISVRVKDRNPVTKKRRKPAHLLSKRFSLRAFQFREKRAIRNLALRLRRCMKTGMEFFYAWNECLDLVNVVAFSYVENFLLKQFCDMVSVCDEQGDAGEKVKMLLKKVRQLYSLDSIEKDLGFFLTEKYFSPRKAEGISVLINSLCKELRPFSALLGDGMMIPKEVLGPIGTSTWIQTNIMNCGEQESPLTSTE